MKKGLKTIPTAVIGGGFLTDTQTPMVEPCLNVTATNIIYNSNAKSVINFGNAQTFSQVQAVLGIELGINFNIGLFSYELSAIYARAIQDTLYTQTFYFVELIELPTQVFVPTSYGINALNSYGWTNYNEGMANFRSVCGDQFIWQIHNGAGLFVAFQIIFNTFQDKQIFAANSNSEILGGLFDTSSYVENIVTKYRLSGNVNLIAYQAGGNPSELAEILTQDANGYYITQCALTNLPACQQVVEGIMSYSANSFANQVNITEGGVPENAAPLGYTYLPYTILGLNPSETILNEEINEARTWLADTYNTLQSQLVFVSHIATSWVNKYFSTEIATALQETINNIINNIDLVEDPNTGAITCYLVPTNCVSTTNTIQSNFYQVNEALIASFNTAYNLVYAGSNTAITGAAFPLGDNSGDIYPNISYIKQDINGNTETIYIWAPPSTVYLCESGISISGEPATCSIKGFISGLTSSSSILCSLVECEVSDDDGLENAIIGITLYAIDNPI
jgi:hypothetical protein